MVTRVPVSFPSHLSGKQVTGIANILVLTLLVLSSFMPVMVNPGPVHASDPESFYKLPYPVLDPAGYGYGVAFGYSGADTYVAVATDSSPYVNIYKKGAGDTFTKLDNPGILPGASRAGVAFSPNATYLATVGGTWAGGDYLTIYKRSSDTFTKLTTYTQPTKMAYSAVAFSPDSKYMAVGQANPPGLEVYSITGSDIFTKLTTVDSPDSSVYGVAFSHDSAYMAIASSPGFTTTYSITGSDIFTKLSTPVDPPAGNSNGVTFNHDSTLVAFAHATTPYVTVYSHAAGVLTRLVSQPDAPAGAGNGVAFSHDSGYLAVAHETTPYITIYRYNGGAFTKVTDPHSLPTSTGYGVTFSQDSSYLALACPTSNKLWLYKKATIPTVTAAGTSTDGSKIILTFSKAMADPSGDRYKSFKYQYGGGGDENINAAVLNTDTTKIELTPQWPILAGDVITVSYTYSEFNGDVTAADYGVLADFTPIAVTNNVPVPPTVVSAATNTAGTVITITFNKNMANPASKHGEFKYRHGGSDQSFSAAALNVDHTKIDLTCAGTTIAYGDTVYVDYTKGTVLAEDGGPLDTFTGQVVTNNISAPPTFSSAATNAAGTVITITFNKNMADPSGKHAQFTYKINGGTAQNFSAAALNASITKIDLTCSGTAIAYGNTITVSYTAGSVVAADGGVLASFTNQPVTNNMPVPAPTFVSAATNTAGTVITITFNKNMANPAGKHGEFKYKINGGAVQSFSAAALNATITKIDLTCSGTAIASGNTITVSYTAGSVVAADGGVLATFTDQAVSNNMPGPPTLVSAATNSTGTAITITFNKNMANPAGKHGEFKYKINGGAVQSFSAAALNATITKIDLTCSGTAIAYGNTVTVSYTTGTVQAADGGILASFADQAVTNNMPGPATTLALTAVPSSVTANGTSISALTATVTDEHGNPVLDGTSVVFTTSKGTVGSSTITKTTSNGIATATLTSATSTEIVIADVSATATATGVYDYAPVFFIPPGKPDVIEHGWESISGSGQVSLWYGTATFVATGEHVITAALYSGNPGGTPSFNASGVYFDIHLDNIAGITSLTLQSCDPDIVPSVPNLTVYYWDGSTWRPASNQVYAQGCITVVITDTTFPNLSALSGLIFAFGTPVTPPTPEPVTTSVSPLMFATPTSHGSSMPGITPNAPPVALVNIQTQSASLSAKTVTPGTPVTVTADIINKSMVNGNKRVTLYVNGQVESTQAMTVNSGSSSKLTFNVSRSEPGDYMVYVDGVPAGSFKVEMLRESDGILIFSAILIAMAFLVGMVMLWRRQRSYY
jgi:uncharacterized repeat protein (TIGR02059 family)